MRVLIVAPGSRGDVAPYTGLGARLREAGHEVAVAAHKQFAELVEGSGLEMRALPGDIHSILPEPGQRYSGGSRRESVERLREYRRQVADGILEAAEQGTDFLLLNSLGQAGLHVAEALRLPSMGVYPHPLEPTRAFPPVLLGSTRSFGGLVNRTLGSVLAALGPASAKELRVRLELPALGGGALQRRLREQSWPVLHGFSPRVLPRPADWREGLEVVGYWWPQTAEGWQPPEELTRFLASGPAPVFVGLGSMAAGKSERTSELVLQAVRAAEVRAVVQSGWAGLEVSGEDVLTVGDVPHEWLFPKMAALVHHAGAGTTGAGLRAGVPSVGVPTMADQFLWANRLTALKVGPAPVPLARLSADSLTAAVRAAVTDPSHRGAAQTLAGQLAAEDGAGSVLAALDRAAGSSSHP